MRFFDGFRFFLLLWKQLNKNNYDKLRVKSIHDVKATNESIDILEAVNELED